MDFPLAPAILEAIDWAVTRDHVNVLNESIAALTFPDTQTADLVQEADDDAVAAGVTVTVAAGDTGVYDTINSPATDPNVITTASTTTFHAQAQVGKFASFVGADGHSVKGWVNDNISSLDSGGEDSAGRTVDLAAPGDSNWALCSPIKKYTDCVNHSGHPSDVQLVGGTSEAAPLTAGVAALVIQAFRQTHGYDPSPALVKAILVSTTDDIGAPVDLAGAGRLNAYRAVLAARAYGYPSTKATAPSLLVRTSQLDTMAAPGTTTHSTETITNEGGTPQSVIPTTRTLSTYHAIGQATFSLTDTASAKFVDDHGIPNNFQRIIFSVPAGQAHLVTDLAYQSPVDAGSEAIVNVTLIDPDDEVVANSFGVGTSNFNDLQVDSPQPGIWTAYVFDAEKAEGGTTGSMVFGVRAATWIPFGSVSPKSFTLAPGTSRTLTFAAKTPPVPGDSAGALILAAGQATVTVPVILRSVVGRGATSFVGTLYGGNGDQPDAGQGAFYKIALPSVEPALNTSIVLSGSAQNPFTAELIDPEGEAVSTASNTLETVSESGKDVITPLVGAQLHVLDPEPGIWTIGIDFYGPESGNALAVSYTVEVNEAAVQASAPGLPDSSRTLLPAGQPTRVDVSIINTGVAPAVYFADGRLDSTETLSLLPLDGPARARLPDTFGVTYLVPSDTTAITTTASAKVPIIDEMLFGIDGDPDILGAVVGQVATASLSANPVAHGLWFVEPEEVGPDGSGGAPHVRAKTSLEATTAAIDPAVSSPYGDIWKLSTDRNYTPHNIPVEDPGQAAHIPVIITPHGPVGSRVQGTLFIDDLVGPGEDENFDANQVAALPYSYTVGPNSTRPRASPTFTSPPTKAVTSKTAFRFLVTTAGAPSPSIGFRSGTTLPKGVVLTDNGNGTAILEGGSSVPGGIYRFTLQAANGARPNASQPFTLKIRRNQRLPIQKPK